MTQKSIVLSMMIWFARYFSDLTFERRRLFKAQPNHTFQKVSFKISIFTIYISNLRPSYSNSSLSHREPFHSPPLPPPHPCTNPQSAIPWYLAKLLQIWPKSCGLAALRTGIVKVAGSKLTMNWKHEWIQRRYNNFSCRRWPRPTETKKQHMANAGCIEKMTFLWRQNVLTFTRLPLKRW